MIQHDTMLQAGRDALIAILPRVNALNSFVRSAAHRRWFVCSLPYVIYHYKREAIMSGESLGLATHRRATVNVQCDRCGGTGRYTDSNGYTWPDCLHCSKGVAHLEFVETTLPGFCWLTPRRQSYELRLGAFADLPETDQAWQVRQPGADLTPSQVADHLCEIEAHFPKRPPVQRSDWNDFDIANTYRIWIGETARGRCAMCGAAMEQPHGMHGITTGRLSWSASVCKGCSDQNSGSVFERMASRLPDELLTPEIRLWAVRHPAPPEKQRSQWVCTDTADAEIPF